MKKAQIIIIVLAILIPILIYLDEWSTIDSCLDHGGSYDYQNMICDKNKNHQFIPFIERHPYFFVDLIIWFAIFSLIYWATLKIKIKPYIVILLLTLMTMALFVQFIIYSVEKEYHAHDNDKNKMRFFYCFTALGT